MKNSIRTTELSTDKPKNLLKKESIAVLAGVSLLLTGNTSFAKTHKHSSTDETIKYSQAATEADEGGRFGLGFSTIGFNGLQNSSFTGVYTMNRDDLLQGFFSIPQTTPFNMGGAVLFKHTLVSSSNAGFHVGGGFGLASINNGGFSGANLGLNFALVAGFHFELPGVPHVVVHLDGGPNFSLINTNPNSQTNFSMTALSPALGASVLYLF